MGPDNYQQAWRSQDAQSRVTVAAELLLREVQRSQRQFESMIFWRDVREVSVSLILIPVWFYLGYVLTLPWSWYLGVPASLWVAGFFVVDRMRHPNKPTDANTPLLACVRESLRQIEHQIWLLRNVLWWYLLPWTVAILAFFVHLGFQGVGGWWFILGLILFVLAIYTFTYFANQRAVDTQLEPRRQELLMMLASLSDESPGAQPVIQREVQVKPPSRLKRLIVILCICLVACGAFIVMSILAGERGEGGGYPRRSPFEAVRWDGDQPEVMLDEQWYRLVSLNGISATEIVTFSRETFADRWRKRFEEDLVEVLSKMGHPPEETVTLELQALDSDQTQVREAVPMTFSNRQAIKRAADARESGRR